MSNHEQRIVKAVHWLAIAIVMLAAVVAAAALKGADDIAGKPVASTVDAVGWALADIATLPESDRPFARFVWIPPWGTDRWIAATNFAVNTAASHAQTIQNGAVIANGWMLRYDLRRLAPNPKQLAKLLATWDGLALQDPYFHVPEQNSKVPAAILSPHLKQQEAVALSGLSLSTGAVYRADFFLVKMLSTLEGGKYYDFLQVDREGSKDSTPQDAWLASLGIFEQQTKALSGDQRTALFRSNITGKPRRIDVLYGLGRGGSLCTITHDISDEDTDAGQHPLRNLIAFSDSAREIIVQRPNGTHAFALTNSDGQFVDSAPDNVARDHTVPAPYTSRLQSAISCIRCHGPHDGYQPFGNDVAKILSSRLDVFSDLKVDGITITREQAVDRLAGLYAGQLDVADGPIGRARRDYLTTVARISTGLIPQAETSLVSEISSEVAGIFSGYKYTPVTPEIAVAELGGAVGQTLDDLLGDPGAAIVVDPIEGSLRAGIAVNRSDWEVVFADLAGKVAARAKP